MKHDWTEWDNLKYGFPYCRVCDAIMTEDADEGEECPGEERSEEP